MPSDWDPITHPVFGQRLALHLWEKPVGNVVFNKLVYMMFVTDVTTPFVFIV